MWIWQPPQFSRAFGRTAAALSEPFRVTTLTDGGCGIVAVEGDLDLATVETLADAVEAVIAAGIRVLVIDLAAVPFCSGTGLRQLARIRARAQDSHIALGWVVRSPALRALLRGNGIAAGFACHRDRAAVLAALGDGQPVAQDGATSSPGKGQG